MSTQQDRVDEALKSCRRIDDDTVKTFIAFCKHYGHDLGYIVQGKPVLDIGCGKNGGLCDFVLEQGATSYTGVDIDAIAVNFSRCVEPRGTFIWDDPIHILSTLKEPHVVVSAAIFDPCILPDDAYNKKLIEAIVRQTPVGWHTAHWGGDLYEFVRYFTNAGFIETSESLCINTGYKGRELFGVYEKVKTNE